MKSVIATLLWTVTATCLLVTLFRAATTPHDVDIIPLALCFAAILVFTVAAGRPNKR